jgi:hypothetical protein
VKQYPGRDTPRAAEAFALGNDDAPEPVPPITVDAAPDTGMDHDLDHDLSVEQSPAIAHSVPGKLSPHRWPGLRDAFAVCNATVEHFPPVPDGDERYLFRHDLGFIPETGWSNTESQALQRIEASELIMCQWRGWGRTPADLGHERSPRLAPGGAIQWEHLNVDAETVTEWEAVHAGGPQPYDAQTKNQFAAMDRLKEAVKTHQTELAIICRRLGLGKDGCSNPTVQGRTWLVQWPVVEAVGLDGTRMRNEAALVVAAPGAILMAGATVMLTLARDLGAEDADLYPTQLASTKFSK